MCSESAVQRVTQKVTNPRSELPQCGRNNQSLLELEEASAHLENKCGAGELDGFIAKVYRDRWEPGAHQPARLA